MNNRITFPTSEQIFWRFDFPFKKQLRMTLRYYAYRFLYRKQCRQLVDFLNENPQWQALFTEDYYRFYSLLMIYCDKRFSAQDRLEAITRNLRIAEQKWSAECRRRLLQEGTIELCRPTDDLHLSLNLNRIDPFEGYFSVSLKSKQNERVYDASFTFLTPNELLITSVQGPSHLRQDSQETIKHATKVLYGIRPMFLLVIVFKLLARQWQCDLLGIPHKAQGKYRLAARSKILFDYNEFWRENKGIYQNRYWRLPLAVERKSPEEIVSKKRSMYRKRYAMLDKMEADILAVLKKN